MDKNNRTLEPITVTLKRTPFEYELSCTPEELESQLTEDLLGDRSEPISYDTTLADIKSVMEKNVKVTGGLGYTLD